VLEGVEEHDRVHVDATPQLGEVPGEEQGEVEAQLVGVALGDAALEERALAEEPLHGLLLSKLAPREVHDPTGATHDEPGAVDQSLEPLLEVAGEGFAVGCATEGGLAADELGHRQRRVLPGPVDRQRRVEGREALRQAGESGTEGEEVELGIAGGRLGEVDAGSSGSVAGPTHAVGESLFQLPAQPALADAAVAVEHEDVAAWRSQVDRPIRLPAPEGPNLGELRLEGLLLGVPIGKQSLGRQTHTVTASTNLIGNSHEDSPPRSKPSRQSVMACRLYDSASLPTAPVTRVVRWAAGVHSPVSNCRAPAGRRGGDCRPDQRVRVTVVLMIPASPKGRGRDG
jgi:hypothetical protein